MKEVMMMDQVESARPGAALEGRSYAKGNEGTHGYRNLVCALVCDCWYRCKHKFHHAFVVADKLYSCMVVAVGCDGSCAACSAGATVAGSVQH